MKSDFQSTDKSAREPSSADPSRVQGDGGGNAESELQEHMWSQRFKGSVSKDALCEVLEYRVGVRRRHQSKISFK